VIPRLSMYCLWPAMVFLILGCGPSEEVGEQDMTARQLEETKQEIWAVIQAMNRAWTVEGDIAKLRDYFHENMVAIYPADRERLEGREACLASYRRYVETSDIHSFKEVDPKIQIHDDGHAAVVTYYYDMSVEVDGQKYEPAGREMIVLVKEDGRWWVVAEQFSPFPTSLQE
jgi:uncharacterized protein (TIGR02246 family)